MDDPLGMDVIEDRGEGIGNVQALFDAEAAVGGEELADRYPRHIIHDGVMKRVEVAVVVDAWDGHMIEAIHEQRFATK